MASTNANGRALCLLMQHAVLWFFLGHCGPMANPRLEEKVATLVGAVTGNDSRTFSSQGGKTASIAPIVGRGSPPSIMF